MSYLFGVQRVRMKQVGRFTGSTRNMRERLFSLVRHADLRQPVAQGIPREAEQSRGRPTLIIAIASLLHRIGQHTLGR